MIKYQIKRNYWKKIFYQPIQIVGQHRALFFRDCFWGGMKIWDKDNLDFNIGSKGLVKKNKEYFAKLERVSEKTVFGKKICSITLCDGNQDLFVVDGDDDLLGFPEFTIDVYRANERVGISIIKSTLFNYGSEVEITIENDSFSIIVILVTIFLLTPLDGGDCG